MAKTKKEKSFEQILDDALVKKNEWPYKIPGNWEWTYLLSGFAECLDSYRKPVNATERAKRTGNIPYYGATGQVGWIDDYLTNEELVLVGEDGAPFLDPFKNKSYMIFGKAWVNNHAHILKSLYGNTGNLFLMHYLNSFDYNGYVSGTTRLKLTQKSLKNIPLPLPPLKEQKRIVKKLSSMLAKVTEARELIQEARDSFENRRAAILNKAFTGELTKKWRYANPISDVPSLKISLETIPYKIPDQWKWVFIKDVSDKFQYGTSAKSEIEGEVPVIRMGNIQHGKIDWNDLKFTSDKTEIEKYNLNFNDVLFNRTNSPALVGKTAIYKGEMPAIFAGYLIRIKPKISLNSDYLNYFLNSPYAKQKCLKVKTDGVNQSNINATKLGNFEIPIPHIKEQQEIVNILDKIFIKEITSDELIDLEESLSLLEKSILSKAFRGELGTNNPEDEPAIKLLERILEEKKSKPIILKPDDIKTSGSVSKPELLVKGPSGNTQVLLEEIKNKYGNKTFRANELKDISELSYEELKEALFELIKEPLDGKSKAKLKMNWAKGYLVQLSE
jgi:type I restriction enzyme, S subunit